MWSLRFDGTQSLIQSLNHATYFTLAAYPVAILARHSIAPEDEAL